MKDYLEAFAKCSNLGDQVIYWLHLKSKPGHMRFEEFLDLCMQILSYVKKGYLHCRLEIPSDAELCKQVFLALLKAH